MDIAQGVFHNGFVPVLAEQDTDAGIVSLLSQLSVHCFEIEIQFACVFRFKINGLEFYHHVTMQTRVVEEQVEKEVTFSDLEGHLPADIRKAGTQFQEEMGDMLNESCFQFSFVVVFGQGQKIKDIRILERLPGKVGLWGR